MICTKGRKIEVLQSAAGYYIGTFDNGPYCRISDCYYGSQAEAQIALFELTFPFRYNAVEVLFCSEGECFLIGKPIYDIGMNKVN